jgi:hypothetical protein
MGSDNEPSTETMLSARSSKVVHAVSPEGAQAPFEVDVEHIQLDPSTVDGAMPYRMLELWTEKRLYVIDTTFTCQEVIDRKTRQTDPNHPFMQARLIGGQRRDGNTVYQIKPFPIVGTSAVFEKPTGPGQPKMAQVTSKVTRVVLNVRVANVAGEPAMSLDHSGAAIRIPKL